MFWKKRALHLRAALSALLVAGLALAGVGFSASRADAKIVYHEECMDMLERGPVTWSGGDSQGEWIVTSYPYLLLITECGFFPVSYHNLDANGLNVRLQLNPPSFVVNSPSDIAGGYANQAEEQITELLVPYGAEVTFYVWVNNTSSVNSNVRLRQVNFSWNVVPIELGETGTLHITKSLGGSIPGLRNDGSELDSTQLQELLDTRSQVANVEYSVIEIPIYDGSTLLDLSTPAGWDVMRTNYYDVLTNTYSGNVWDWLQGEFYQTRDDLNALNAYPLIDRKPTDANGQVEFDLDAYHLYFVYESNTPLGVMEGVPFLVTVPRFPDETAPYDVYVYPKNETVHFTKELIDPSDCGEDDLAHGADPIDCAALDPSELQGTKVGDLLVFRLVADVPTLAAGNEYKSLWIEDVLPAGLTLATADITDIDDPYQPKLTFAGTAAEYYEDWVEWDPQSGRNGTARDTDLCSDDTNYIISISGNTIEFNLTGDCSPTSGGLSYSGGYQNLNLERYESADDLQLVLTIFARATMQGSYSNMAQYHINNAEIRSNVVTVSYGGYSIWKYGADKASALHSGLTNRNELENALIADSTLGDFDTSEGAAPALPGAEFAVFSNCTDALAFQPLTNSGSTPVGFHSLNGDPENVADPAYYDEADLGTIVQRGTTDNYGHLMIGGLAYGTYCVREIGVPANYQVVDNIFEIVIGDQLDGLYFDEGTAVDDILIPNMPLSAGFPFPITGGTADFRYLFIAGAVLIGTIYLVKRQKPQSA